MWRSFTTIVDMSEFYRSAAPYAYAVLSEHVGDSAKAAFTNLTPCGLTNAASFLSMTITRDHAGRCLIGVSDEFWSVFSPVSPHGDAVRYSQSRSLWDSGHFWIYGRTRSEPHSWNLVGEDLTRIIRRDNEISWYYQKLLSTLNDEEYEKERAYRASAGLPALPERR